MNDTAELLVKIRSGLSVLEQGDREDFDLITALFAILQGTTRLLATTCDEGKIKDWQDRDDIAFYRFASLLKIGLELQRDYLVSVSGRLLLENDTVAQKIAAAQAEIDSLLTQEQTVLKKALPLFEQEAKLREVSSRVKTLLSKRDELAALEQALAAVDESALSAEIEQKKQTILALQNSQAPLISRQKKLQKSIAELTELTAGLTAELDRLEKTYGEESQRLAENIPRWVERIRARRPKRAAKIAEQEDILAREAAELATTEKQLQEQLEKSNELLAAIMDKREALQKHFAANQRLGDRFCQTLPGVRTDLSRQTEVVTDALSHLDRLLSAAQQQIQALAKLAAERKSRGIGE